MILTNPPELPDGGPAHLVVGSIAAVNADGDKKNIDVFYPGESIRDRIFVAAIGGCAPEVMREHCAAITRLAQDSADGVPEARAAEVRDQVHGLIIAAVGVADLLTDHAMATRQANIEAMMEKIKPKGDNHKDKNKSRIIQPGQEGNT